MNSIDSIDSLKVENHPHFNYGETVDISSSWCALCPEGLQGKVVGYSSTGIVDMWIIMLDEFPNWGMVFSYPFKAVVIPHMFLKLPSDSKFPCEI